MSDNEATKGKVAGSGWTDRERVRRHSLLPYLLTDISQLAYLVSLIEHSETKFNFKVSLPLLTHSLSLSYSHFPPPTVTTARTITH